MNKIRGVLCLFLSQFFIWQSVYSQEAQEELSQDDDLIIEEVEPVKVEENRFDKEKWEKKKYDRFEKRRAANGLPEKLYLAGDDVLSRDPSLKQSDITSTIAIPESKAVLTEKMAVYVNLLPDQLPDTNLLFNDANVTNALSVGTGQIILPAGIIKDFQTEDAVMFVLAHELGHIALDHFKAKENRDALNQGATIVAMVANDMNANKAAQSDELAGYMIFSEKLLGPSWSKSNEKSADELAVDLIVRANYNLEIARKVLDRFVLLDREREAEIELKCGGKQNIGNVFGNLLGASFGQRKEAPPAECASYKKGFLGGLFSGKRSSSKRLEEFDKYVATRYPTYANPKPIAFTGVLQRDFAEDGTLQRSVYAAESMAALQNGQFELATQYAIASYKDDDQSLVKPRLAMYTLLQRAGRYEEALAHLDIALASPQASQAVYTFAIRERLGKAYTIAAQLEQKRINEIVTGILEQYGTDNLAALAAAQEAHEALKTQERQYWERGARPPVYNAAEFELSPEAIVAYEAVLELARAAQVKFPDAAEFLMTEIEVLRTLKRQAELLQRIDSCKDSKDKSVQAFCKMAISV